MKEFVKGLWSEHPNLRQLLGMCPTLAVTTSALNGLSMGLSVVFVLFFSCMAVSLMRSIVPPQVRIAVYTVIIAAFVTVIDIFFRAYFPQISKALGPYLPLIIVNCIILGRCEAFASKNPLGKSLWDALGMGLGFTWGLALLGGLREIFGAGTLFGFTVMPASYDKLLIMILPPGAFILLGLMIAGMNSLEKKP